MKVLYICNSVERWNFKEDTTPLMIAEAESRGKKTYYTSADKLFCSNYEIFAEFFEIGIKPIKPFYKLSKIKIDSIKSFDVIHIRVDPPFDLKYYYTTILLEMVTKDVLVVNSPEALRSLNEKLSILNFPQFITDTFVAYNTDRALHFINSIGGKAVAKSLRECSSKGIVLLEGSEKQVSKEIKKIFAIWSQPILFQKYLPQVVHGETRITLIDGKVAGYMKKIPEQGNFLASLDFNASVQCCELTPRDRELSNIVGKFLKDNEILLAALDVIDGHLSEINITSPGLLKHTNEVMGIKLEAVLEDVIDEMIKESNKC